MPGAWEIVNQKSVMVGILYTDTTTVAWSFGLRNLIVPGNFPICAVAGMPYDMARNTVCVETIRSGADFLFFLDSDVIPPRDAILRLMTHDKPVVSGIYCRRSPPVGVPVMMKNGQWINSFPPNTLIDVDVVGAGCLLIRRDLLLTLPPQRPGSHWFDWRVNQMGFLPKEECMSEDYTFCLAVRRMGIPILVDTSIQCKHIGLAQSLHGRYEACETSPIT